MTKIVIFGAGQVGYSVAVALSDEENDVTLIDRNEVVLGQKVQHLDIKTIHGNATDPNTLDAADIEDAELVLAVTDQDDTNILVCQLAYMLGNTPQLIARLRNPEFHKRKDLLFGRQEPHKIPIDAIISPEKLVTDQIMRLVRHPGALQIVEFAKGKIQLVAIQADHSGKLVGHKIKELREHMPNVDSRVAAIYRHDRPIIPQGDTVIQPKDEVFFIAAPEHIADMMTELRTVNASYGKRVMLVGAGNIGMRLAREMSEMKSGGFRVKLIEKDKERAQKAAHELPDTVVIHGDAADQDLMLRGNIENTEVFCSVSNEDEVNILSAMMAKRLGAKRTMALINNSAYAELLENTGIDIVISPNLNTISELLRYIRRGGTVAVHSLRRGAAEAIETVAYGSSKSDSKVVGRTIGELNVPSGTTVGAILRDDQVLIAHSDIVIEDKDHVILFVVDKGGKQIESVQKLFQPSPLYV